MALVVHSVNDLHQPEVQKKYGTYDNVCGHCGATLSVTTGTEQFGDYRPPKLKHVQWHESQEPS